MALLLVAKGRIGFWIGLAGIFIGLGILYFRFNPAAYPFFPKCPFFVLTGLQCPGCGSQRALHHVLHFDLYAACKDNILFVLALPYLFVGYILEYTFWGKTKIVLRQRLYGQAAKMIVLVVVISFWVLRNLI